MNEEKEAEEQKIKELVEDSIIDFSSPHKILSYSISYR